MVDQRINVVAGDTDHAKLHNDANTEINRLGLVKADIPAVWGLISEWRIDFDVATNTWPARNVPAAFTTAYPNKRVVWASATSAPGRPPGMANGDFWEYYE